MQTAMVLKIEHRGEWPVTTLREASALYQIERERSGLGASSFPDGLVHMAGAAFARISYNGRVWPPEDWHPKMRPILEASNDAGVALLLVAEDC